jgi:hypothetical protein
MVVQRRKPPSRSRRRASREGASERWLLLLGVVALVIVVAGSWPFETPPLPPITRSLTMAEARMSNAAVPIEGDRRRRALPYRFRGGPAAREQAAECLATAALYEAGDDARGQRAVIQVTGCQFSFTCDGSFARRPVHLGWAGARRAARRALAGYVFADVGRATHYHTDWMVPYWRDSLIKVARVRSHLFYVRS